MRGIGRRIPALAAVLLGPWTAAIATGLPDSALARHWNTAWAGLDLAIMCGLALTSWLCRQRDARALIAATATVTLMCADAWFDVCTAAGGAPLAAAVAEGSVELAVAVACLFAALRAGAPQPGRP